MVVFVTFKLLKCLVGRVQDQIWYRYCVTLLSAMHCLTNIARRHPTKHFGTLGRTLLVFRKFEKKYSSGRT